MRKTLIFLLLFALKATAFAQVEEKIMKKMGPNPVVFLDSVEIEASKIDLLDPFDISNITIVKPKKAKKLLGGKGGDGAFYITTIKAAKLIYWNFFCKKSAAYKSLINTPQGDTIVQYILNGDTLSRTAAPGNLFLITDANFKSLIILDNAKSIGEDVITKRYVVLIKTRRPKGLVKTKTSS